MVSAEEIGAVAVFEALTVAERERLSRAASRIENYLGFPSSTSQYLKELDLAAPAGASSTQI